MKLLSNWRWWGLLGLALLLRLVWLDWVPARLTVDEMSIGYNAFSIAKTAKDEWGRQLPVVFEAFGDFKLPLYIYLTVPFVWAMGLSVWSVKVVSILAGLGFLLLVGLMAVRITQDERAGWWTGLIVAVSPWTIHLSRQALESHLALLLFTAALYLLMTTIKKKQAWKQLLLVGILLGLTGYTYIAYRALVILVLPLLIWWIGMRRFDRWGAVLAGIVLIWLPLLPQFISTSGLARARQTSIFTDPGIEAAVIENRSFCYLVEPRLTPVCRMLFNKVTEMADRWVGNYLSFFSSDFLFVSGDKNLYLNNPDYGQFVWVFLPLLFLGLMLLSKLTVKDRGLLWGLLLLAPLPGSLSGSAQMVRSSALLLPLCLLLGLGAWHLFSVWHERSYGWVKMLALGLMGLMTFQFLVSYFVIYPTKHDNAAYQLPSSVAAYVGDHYTQFSDGILVDHRFSDAHIFLAYYLKLDPDWYQKNVIRPATDGFGFSHPTQLGAFRFGVGSFNEAYCRDRLQNFLYISPDPVTVRLPDGNQIGYASKDYFNFSGVHPQVRLIEANGLRDYLSTHGIAMSDFCR